MAAGLAAVTAVSWAYLVRTASAHAHAASPTAAAAPMGAEEASDESDALPP